MLEFPFDNELAARNKALLLAEPAIANLVSNFKARPSRETAAMLLSEAKTEIVMRKEKAEQAEAELQFTWCVRYRPTIISEQFNLLLREIWDGIIALERGDDYRSILFLKPIYER